MDKIIQRIQRLLGFDLGYVAHGFSWLFTSTVVRSLTILVLSYLFANYLDPSVYGTYKYIIAVGTTLTLFTLSGLPTFLKKDAAKYEKNFLRSGFLVQYRWGLLMTAVSFLVAGYYYVNGDPVLAAGIGAFGIIKPLALALHVYHTQLSGYKRFKLVSIFTIGHVLVYGVFMASVTLVFNDPNMLVLTFLLSELLMNGIFYLYTKHLLAAETKASVSKKTIHQGFQLSLSIIPRKILRELDAIVVFQFLGAAQVALYAFTVLIPKEISSLKKLVGGLYLPKIAKRDAQTIRYTIHRKAALMFFGSTLLCGAYAAAAPLLFELLFPQYIEGILLTQLAGLMFLAMPERLYYEALTVFENTKAMHILDIGTPTIRLGLLALLFPFFGLLGIVLALVLSQLLRLAVSVFLFHFSANPPMNHATV